MLNEIRALQIRCKIVSILKCLILFIFFVIETNPPGGSLMTQGLPPPAVPGSLAKPLESLEVPRREVDMFNLALLLYLFRVKRI